MANPTTNVDVAPIWKLPLRDLLARPDYNGAALVKGMDSLEQYLEKIRPITFLWGANNSNAASAAIADWNAGLGAGDSTGGESNQNIMKAPHDCTMLVHVDGWHLSVANSTVAYYIVDDASAAMIPTVSGQLTNDLVANKWTTFSIKKWKHYNAGQTMGYKLRYSTSAALQLETRATVQVTILPRRRSALSTNNYA